jgi:hypothetical protein
VSFNEAWLVFGILFALAVLAAPLIPRIDPRRLS